MICGLTRPVKYTMPLAPDECATRWTCITARTNGHLSAQGKLPFATARKRAFISARKNGRFVVVFSQTGRHNTTSPIWGQFGSAAGACGNPWGLLDIYIYIYIYMCVYTWLYVWLSGCLAAGCLAAPGCGPAGSSIGWLVGATLPDQPAGD